MSTTRGIGLFTAKNIIAIMNAIPETNGTYDAIAKRAAELGAQVAPNTIANWVTAGNADIRDRKHNTAYARFAKRFADLIGKHCAPDDNRNRELDRAFNELGNRCECGNPKATLPNGRTASKCSECAELDQQRPRVA